jgi:Alr-MurF fusion protein
LKAVLSKIIIYKLKNKNYSIQQISKVIDGQFIVNNNSEISIDDYFIDSRNFSHKKNNVFFAIPGERNNGHQYIAELNQKGVSNFIVCEKHEAYSLLADCNVVLVKNTIEALQQLAIYHRKQFKLPVIGITGSNGKTTVKEWLFELLKDKYQVVRSPKSYNSQVGVPLSVLNILPEHQIAIFEAGISKKNEMQNLQKIIEPTIGIFTNIGAAHNEGFESIQSKVHEKLKLFKAVETLIYCKDHLLVQEAIQNNFFEKQPILFSWSQKPGANVLLKEKKEITNGFSLQISYNGDSFAVDIPFKDDASIENNMHCCSLLLLLNYEPLQIAEKLKQLYPISMRMELLQGNNNCLLINDVYSADFDSLEIALNLLSNQKSHKQKTIIMSDLLQTGLDSNELYSKVAKLLEAKKINKVFGIGEEIYKAAKNFEAFSSEFYPSTQLFIQSFQQDKFINEAILIKGARVFNFEDITALLQQQAHETVLEVNMTAIVHNLNFYKSQLKSDCKIMAMVKALSYGSGTYEIANLLEFQRVDYLAVAYADEGVQLRKHGISLPIMVMNPDAASYDTMIGFNLEPEIYSFRTLEEFLVSLRKSGHSTEYQVHIKFDTGMHRLGFNPNENEMLCHKLVENKQIKVSTVFSHLAASNDIKHIEFTKQQILLFSELASQMEQNLGYKITKHIANTGGITALKESHFDMVRLGIGLYGIPANKIEENNLVPAGTLKTIISQIRNVVKGESIGYSRNAILERNSRIATIPIGYADGFDRRLGNGNGLVLINGKTAKTIGNICMDMCMIDVTDIPCNEKDGVLIFGKDLPIANIAKATKTISYEVITGISPRVKRVFIQE